MKKTALIFTFVAMMISVNLFAQRTSDIDGSKDYPAISRFEGSVIEFYKVTKSDKYKIPLNFEKGNLDFVNPVTVEGKVIRIQYSVSPDNNTSYVVKSIKSSLIKEGFKVIFAKSNDEMVIGSKAFSRTYYNRLNNKIFGFAYGTEGKDQAFIIAKKENEGKGIFACIYISGFDNTTLITQDVIEAESVTKIKENSLITDFKGAIKFYRQKTKWNTYMVPVGKKAYSGWSKKIKAEGEITRTQYITSKDDNPSFIYMNYNEALKKSNWNILFGGSGSSELGYDSYEWQYAMFQEGFKQGDKFGDKLGFRANDRSKYAYIAAEFEDLDTLYYAVIYIIDKGWGTMINQDVIKSKKPDVGLVTAKMLTEKINKQGHLSLEGIFFETGKAALTSQSDAALKNISEYLNSHKDKKFFIVGHTDNVGDFASNMTLSENRAKAVMTELTTKYGADAAQLKAYGVADLAPVVSNSTDAGKARNRRVEIVEQ